MLLSAIALGKPVTYLQLRVSSLPKPYVLLFSVIDWPRRSIPQSLFASGSSVQRAGRCRHAQTYDPTRSIYSHAAPVPKT